MSSEGTCCDTCGRWFFWHEFVETIEEVLCEDCASGVSEDDHDGFPDMDWDDDDHYGISP